MRKLFFILMMIIPCWLLAQEDYYLDRQQKRIFTYSAEEIRKVVNFNALLPVEQSCMNWLRNQQHPSGLAESYEGSKVSYTYDDSLAVILYLFQNNPDLAKKSLEFFKKQWENEIKRFGEFTGFADMYKVSGKVGNDSRAVGPNAWMLLALNYYMQKTADRTYLEMARSLADWILTFQNKYNNGLWGGTSESGGPFLWMSTEHNLDAYAALQGLYFLTQEKRYKEAALKIRTWLDREVWNKGTGRFYNGQDDPNYATDVSSWAVMSLAEKEFFPALDFALAYAGNKQFYKPNNKEVAGFDFGGTYGRSPYPDKDAVWFEGTGQMVLAFFLAGRKDEAQFYLEELKKALVRSEKYDDSTGLPYASNPGTPPYGGWIMPDKPICISSTAWFLMALKNFNPFYARTNSLEELSQVMIRKEAAEGPADVKIVPENKEKEKEKKPEKGKDIEQELFGE